MKSAILIDGISQYSSIKSFYQHNSLDPLLFILFNVLKSSSCQVLFMDGRDKGFEMKTLHGTIEERSPDFILVKADETNIKSIERLTIPFSKEKVYIMTTQKDLPVPPVYRKVWIDESQGHRENIESIMNTLALDFEFKTWEYNPKYWESDDEFIKTKKAPFINIGNGCDRGCGFCEISNTPVKLNDVHSVIDEIDYLLSQKKRTFFHIQNHNIFNRLLFLEQLCNEIQKRRFNTPFAWSCYLAPESFESVENKEVLFRKLANTNLKQVFLGVEHVNQDILNQYHIDFDKSSLISNIKTMLDIGIESVVINYIIGSPRESAESMSELIDFSKQLLEETRGAVEFNVNYYTDKSHVNYLQKGVCNNDTDFLTKYQIMNYKKELYSLLLKEMNTRVANWSTEERYNHVVINELGLKTQYWFYNLSRTAFYKMYRATKHNHAKYQFQIEGADNFLNYSPYVFVLFECEGNQKYISIDPRLNHQHISKLYLNEDDFFLLEIAKRFLPLGEIVKLLSERGYDYDEALKKALTFYGSLESLGLLVYYKAL